MIIQKYRLTCVWLATLLFSTAFIFLWNNQLIQNIEEQFNINLSLQGKIKQLREKMPSEEVKHIKMVSERLTEQLNILHYFQLKSNSARLFDELTTILPTGIHLKQLKRQDNKIEMAGYTSSNSSLEILLKNLNKSSRLKYPNVLEIKKNAQRSQYFFKLNMWVK